MTLDHGDITVTLPDLCVSLRGKPVHLSLQQLKLLLILLDEKEPVSVSELVERIDLTSSAALRWLVASTRKALNNEYIITIFNKGYSL